MKYQNSKFKKQINLNIKISMFKTIINLHADWF